MSVAMFRAPAGFTPKSTSGFVTILEARKKGIGAVLAESNARREHPGLAQHALWATADLMEKADAAERDEMREAVVLSVLETMRAHRNHSLVQFNGVKALTAATAAEGHNELVAREGAVAAVLDAMQSHANTLDSGWALLGRLGEYQSLLGDKLEPGPPEPEPESAGTAEGAADSAEGAGAEEAAGAAADAAAASGDGSDRVGRVLSVLRAMTVHLPRVNVQQYGIAALYGLISGDSNEETGGEIPLEEQVAAGEGLIAAEGVGTVLRALQTHAAQDEVQNGGLRLLRLCCECDERLSAFVGRAVAAHSGGIGALLDGMRGCVRLAPSLADGLVVMAAVVNSSEAGHNALVQAGGVRVALQSVRSNGPCTACSQDTWRPTTDGMLVDVLQVQCHESVVTVQCVGLRLLAALSAAPASVPPILKEGGMRTVMHGLRVHAANDPCAAKHPLPSLPRHS